MDFDELPDMLTVEEMAKALRLGRSQAYELTKRYRLTGDKEGIPALSSADASGSRSRLSPSSSTHCRHRRTCHEPARTNRPTPR